VTGPVRRVSLPSAVGENRERIRELERAIPRVAMRSPGLLGQTMFPAAIPLATDPPTLRVRGGYIYRLDPTLDLTFGDELTISYTHHSGSLYRIAAARVHLIEGLDLSRGYWMDDPNRSAPFSGSIGAPDNPTVYLHDGLQVYMAVTDVNGDTATWTSPASVGLEQYSFDFDVGHVGYSIIDFSGAPVTSDDVVAFSGGPVETSGSITTAFQTGPVSEFEIGSTTIGPGPSFAQGVGVTLTSEAPGGSVLMIVVVTQDWEFPENTNTNIGGGSYIPISHGFNVVDQRPFVYASFVQGEFQSFVQELPHYYENGQWWPMIERLGDHIQNGTIDGGGP